MGTAPHNNSDFSYGKTIVRARPKQLIGSKRAPRWREHKIFALQPWGCRSGGAVPSPRAVPVCPGCAAPGPPGSLRSSREKRWAEEAEGAEETAPSLAGDSQNTQKSRVCPFRRAVGTSAAASPGGRSAVRLPRACPGEDTGHCPAGTALRQPSGQRACRPGTAGSRGSSRGFVPRGTKPAGPRPCSEMRSSSLSVGKLLTASLFHCC